MSQIADINSVHKNSWTETILKSTTHSTAVGYCVTVSNVSNKRLKRVDILKARYAEKEACNILQMLIDRYGQT